VTRDRPKMTSEERAQVNRRNIEGRWGPHRADRVAQGLPPTREEELGRKPSMHTDPVVEEVWIARVRELGIDRREAVSRNVPEVTRRQLRRLAFQLSESETARLAETPPNALRDEQRNDRGALIAYESAQVARWRRRAEQERELAREHDRFADDHEQRLADLLMRGEAE
jgi:hypothetical protein